MYSLEFTFPVTQGFIAQVCRDSFPVGSMADAEQPDEKQAEGDPPHEAEGLVTPKKKPAAAQVAASPKVVPSPKTAATAKAASEAATKASLPKGKAKCKAKAKAKAPSGIKRPAAAVESTPKKAAKAKAGMKKPAAAGKSSMDWALGIKPAENEENEADEKDAQEEVEEEMMEDPEEEEQQDEEEGDDIDPFEMDQRKKDRSKDNKFKMLLAQKSLPSWIVQAWEKTKSMKTGRTIEQRKLVNQVLDRTANGHLVVNLNKPALQNLQD